MVYRAKITKIQPWVESNYNINLYTIVRDKKDVYIELKDEEEAEMLEAINKAQEKVLKLKTEWMERAFNFYIEDLT